MKIYFRDEKGVVCATVDEYGVQFLDGLAIFSTLNSDEYQIPVEQLIEIVKN